MFIAQLEQKLSLNMKSAKNVKKGTTKKSLAKVRPEATPSTTIVPDHKAAATGKLTTIQAVMDVGFGNALYLRGEGAGLSWDKGVTLTCIDSCTWRWTGEVEGTIRFKLLLNDAVWASGEDLMITPGESLIVRPEFPIAQSKAA
jgi:hypothetical protein